jgi:hypothetical protein
MPAVAMLTRVALLPHPRVGPQPRLRRALPHLQEDQFPPEEAVEELVERCLCIPFVRSKQSRMASPASHALYLSDEIASGPPEAFIDGHEFCHLHPLPEGTVHLTLPAVLRNEVMRLSWGEPHPIAAAGILATLMTVYAPRDHQEVDIVFGLVEQSCQFAQGKLRLLYGAEGSLRKAP